MGQYPLQLAFWWPWWPSGFAVDGALLHKTSDLGRGPSGQVDGAIYNNYWIVNSDGWIAWTFTERRLSDIRYLLTLTLNMEHSTPKKAKEKRGKVKGSKGKVKQSKLKSAQTQVSPKEKKGKVKESKGKVTESKAKAKEKKGKVKESRGKVKESKAKAMEKRGKERKNKGK